MKILIIVVAVLVLIGAGLGYKVLSTQSTTPTTSDSVVPQGSANPSTTGTVPSDSMAISIEASEYKFTPSTITVKPGQKVSLTVKNTGGMPHDWIVEGQNISTKMINPSGSSVLEFTAPSTAGEYVTFCSVGTHRSLGMVGKLIVK